MPVVAAGGIGDARGLVACMALGAQGVQMGTLFEASEESSAPGEWKAGIIKARETDTIVTSNGQINARVVKEEIYPGGIMTGQIAGMVQKIEKSADIIARIVADVAGIYNTIGAQIR